uniref:Cation efflux protein transmembrane domain-containing protein n=1 Tax=Caenorhabditis japonica TaxID=281687 RepID=A0A8R1DV28_CAEJA
MSKANSMKNDPKEASKNKTPLDPEQPSTATPLTLDILKTTKKKEMGVYAIMIIVNLANVGLVLIKGVAAYVSSSFSIGTSAIESFGDVFVSILLFVQFILDKKVKKSEYPRGRSSESTTNLTASVVMMALASVNFIQSFDALITGKLVAEFGKPHIAVVVINIIVKVFLFFICLIKRDNNQIHVLMRDQLTDVLTNSIALVAVCLAHFYWKECDFIGAAIIFVLIIRNWAPIASETWFKLQGVKGDEEVNKEVSKILSENRILFSKLAGFVTYHIGNKCIVEIYCELALEEIMPNIRSEIYSKFEGKEEIQAVYLLPISEVKNTNAVNLNENGNLPSETAKREQFVQLLQSV